MKSILYGKICSVCVQVLEMEHPTLVFGGATPFDSASEHAEEHNH
jgi:hypothetical protein